MARDKIDEVPMLSNSQSHDSSVIDVELQSFPMSRSASMSLPTMRGIRQQKEENKMIPFSGPIRSEGKIQAFLPISGPLPMVRGYEGRSISTSSSLRTLNKVDGTDFEGGISLSGGRHETSDNHGKKHEHLLKSGPLGRCNDPFCTTCPSYYGINEKDAKMSHLRPAFDYKVHSTLFGGAKSSIKSFPSLLFSCIPGIMNPHAKIVQQWNKFFVISCLVAIFVDPLFFFVLSVKQDYRCIILDRPLTVVITVLRSITDFFYFLHMLLQFRLAYVGPESRVVGAGDLVDDPKEIAQHYLCRYFLLDLFVVLPLPQIMILVVLPKYVGSSAANYAKNLLRISVLLQYVPRMVRFLPLLAGSSATGFIFESAWANFVINILIFILAGHVVGSCWYLFGLQRVNQCLRDVCNLATDSSKTNCSSFIDCSHGEKIGTFSQMDTWMVWRNNTNATDCLMGSNSKNFTYGIYNAAVPVTMESSFIKKYTYSLFWGFQQISTLAGNQVPSLFPWEVLFTMGIIGLGLLLFALLIGNMQNFLQSLGRRRLEMQLRRRDVEIWMERRRLPLQMRSRVRQSERFKWAANQGVNEEELMEALPEDLQREIRRHLCLDLLKKVRIFTVMDEQVLDAFCERLRQRLYIGESVILRRDHPIDKMIFIVRGNLESIGKDSGTVTLSGGDICGEELLTWCLEHSGVQRTDNKKFRRTGQRAISSRTVRCLSNVEAFSLQAADLEEVTRLFSRLLRNPKVQGAIRYESPYWKTWAATCIQVAWKYRKKRLNRNLMGNNDMND
ncbi:probable cyclic nucleotide-gated ion channel 20, chloroplastic [Cryptomeria japonica]|uniref:probable cyclic nucleotide-gated ion channel 20, chloroplastic n=2 Tax=Cryptomeria japonica TaxID=3369 RepID=UPI0025AC1A05|nr:probable cyclic nucleotide-gated ion channel 20, chloroplastic [Cryptomeria japonica]